jgi:hypothetical protein
MPVAAQGNVLGISMLCSTVVLRLHSWLHEAKNETRAQQVEKPGSWPAFRSDASCQDFRHLQKPSA